jgi:hypothetical protein
MCHAHRPNHSQKKLLAHTKNRCKISAFRVRKFLLDSCNNHSPDASSFSPESDPSSARAYATFAGWSSIPLTHLPLPFQRKSVSVLSVACLGSTIHIVITGTINQEPSWMRMVPMRRASGGGAHIVVLQCWTRRCCWFLLPWSRTAGWMGFPGSQANLATKETWRSCVDCKCLVAVRIRLTQAMTARNCYNTFQQQ